MSENQYSALHPVALSARIMAASRAIKNRRHCNMHIRNQKDFWAGLLFAAFGLFFSGFGTRYTFGSAARMGPGYFPTVLGVILILMGVGIALMALSPKADAHKVDRFSWSTIIL